MIEAILGSGIAGFATSLFTPFIKGHQDRKNKELDMRQLSQEQSHELLMLKTSASYQKQLQEMYVHQSHIQREIEIVNAKGRIDEAMQKSLYTGNSKMDSFISSVRPVITYAFSVVFLGIFSYHAIHSIFSENDIVTFFANDFTKNMEYLFANIVTFWFGNRMIEKLSKS